MNKTILICSIVVAIIIFGFIIMRILLPKQTKKIHNFINKHKLAFSITTVIIIASITAAALFVSLSSNNAKKVVPQTKDPDNTGTVVLSDVAEARAEASSPSEGPLQYYAVATNLSQLSATPTFTYVTSEKLGERLIDLNDQIIASLKTAGTITDDTPSYTINYFDDKTVAQSFFTEVNKPTTSVKRKLELKNNYVAKMMYSRKLGLNILMRMSNGQIIKKY